MVGSMLNSHTAAHLMPWADRGFGDVDGPLLVKAESQVFEGGQCLPPHVMHLPMPSLC